MLKASRLIATRGSRFRLGSPKNTATDAAGGARTTTGISARAGVAERYQLGSYLSLVKYSDTVISLPSRRYGKLNETKVNRRVRTVESN
jgi:hypothetical protein